MGKTDLNAEIKNSFKHMVAITTGKKKKNRSGAYTLMFSGVMCTLLGSTFLVKSSFFSTVVYSSLPEALRKLQKEDEEESIPVEVYGKIVRVIDDNNAPAILKKTVESHSSVFDERSNSWVEQNTTLKITYESHSFDVMTPGGCYIHVLLPETVCSRDVSVMSLVQGTKHQLTDEEQEEYAPELSRFHLSNGNSIQRGVYEQTDILQTNHHIHLRGMLTKRNNEYYLCHGIKTKLYISSKSIEEQQSSGRLNGMIFSVLGIALTAFGLYRQYY